MIDPAAYLIDENRVLRQQLGGRQLRLSDMIVVGSAPERIGLAVPSCGRSPRSRRLTPCCGGIAN